MAILPWRRVRRLGVLPSASPPLALAYAGAALAVSVGVACVLGGALRAETWRGIEALWLVCLPAATLASLTAALAGPGPDLAIYYHTPLAPAPRLRANVRQAKRRAT